MILFFGMANHPNQNIAPPGYRVRLVPDESIPLPILFRLSGLKWAWEIAVPELRVSVNEKRLDAFASNRLKYLARQTV